MAICPYGYYLGSDGLCHYSGWNSWGRWVLAGLFLAFVVTAVLLWARRFQQRRKRQQQWRGGPAPTPLQPQPMPPQYAHYGQYPQPPPPPPPVYATKPGAGYNSYYAGNEEGVASPANVYTPRDNEYQPPSGPPPGQKY